MIPAIRFIASEIAASALKWAVLLIVATAGSAAGFGLGWLTISLITAAAQAAQIQGGSW